MNGTTLAPQSAEELAEMVRSTPRLIPVGAGTKPRLSQVEAVKLSTADLRGIREYDPSEFTFTAAAGTPVREIAAVLAARGQYLPFDPMLIEAGATIGGTVAAGLSGPGRVRFGGLRDFILGVRFVDGAGRLLRMGGKVVKNAAGFDLPKFFVGSLGRCGVITDVTFKVFPRSISTVTIRLAAATLQEAQRIFTEAANSRFEFDALDLVSGESGVLARLAGPPAALDALASQAFARWPGEILPGDAAKRVWESLREFRWIHSGGPLVKVALSPVSVSALGDTVQTFGAARWHLSAGGNVAFISLSDAGQSASLDVQLQEHGLSAVTLRGDAPLWLGRRTSPAIARAVKNALDPENRFPSLED